MEIIGTFINIPSFTCFFGGEVSLDASFFVSRSFTLVTVITSLNLFLELQTVILNVILNISVYLVEELFLLDIHVSNRKISSFF